MREDQTLHVNLLTGREEASNNDSLLVLKRTGKKRSFDPPRTNSRQREKEAIIGQYYW
jgi:hypothetical protein